MKGNSRFLRGKHDREFGVGEERKGREELGFV